MQGHETDRIKMDDRDYSIVCFQCGTVFEATRSDASFCSASCRVAHGREAQKRLNALSELESMRMRIHEISRKYKNDEEILKALGLVQTATLAAQYAVKYT